MKILFIGPTRIGDTILSTSIINFYLKKFNDCNFSVVTSPYAKNLFTRMPRLDDLIVINKKKFGLHWIDIIKFSIFKKWDLVIDLRSSATSYLLFTKERKIFRGNNDFHKIIQFQKFLNTDEKLVPKVWSLCHAHELLHSPPGPPLHVTVTELHSLWLSCAMLSRGYFQTKITRQLT